MEKCNEPLLDQILIVIDRLLVWQLSAPTISNTPVKTSQRLGRMKERQAKVGRR